MMEEFLRNFVIEELRKLTEDHRPLPRFVEPIRSVKGLYDAEFQNLFSEFLTAKLKRIATSPIEEIRIFLEPFSVSVFYNLNRFSVVKNISYGTRTAMQSEGSFFYGIVVKKDKSRLLSQSFNLGNCLTWKEFFELIKL